MQLLLCITDDDSDRELRELRGLLESRPAGVIIVPTTTPRSETAALLKHVETIQLIRKHERLGAHSVIVNDREGVFAATRHLIGYSSESPSSAAMRRSALAATSLRAFRRR